MLITINSNYSIFNCFFNIVWGLLSNSVINVKILKRIQDISSQDSILNLFYVRNMFSFHLKTRNGCTMKSNQNQYKCLHNFIFHNDFMHKRVKYIYFVTMHNSYKNIPKVKIYFKRLYILFIFFNLFTRFIYHKPNKTHNKDNK